MVTLDLTGPQEDRIEEALRGSYVDLRNNENKDKRFSRCKFGRWSPDCTTGQKLFKYFKPQVCFTTSNFPSCCDAILFVIKEYINKFCSVSKSVTIPTLDTSNKLLNRLFEILKAMMPCKCHAYDMMPCKSSLMYALLVFINTEATFSNEPGSKTIGCATVQLSLGCYV